MPNPLRKKKLKEKRDGLPGEAAGRGEMEGDGQELLTNDDLARCSQWRHVCWLKDDCLNGGPLDIVTMTSAASFFYMIRGATASLLERIGLGFFFCVCP